MNIALQHTFHHAMRYMFTLYNWTDCILVSNTEFCTIQAYYPSFYLTKISGTAYLGNVSVALKSAENINSKNLCEYCGLLAFIITNSAVVKSCHSEEREPGLTDPFCLFASSVLII